MPDLSRFGISMDSQLLSRFDGLIERKGYANRSEAIRDLVRNALVEEQWALDDEETIGAVTIVYDHHARELADKLKARQHEQHRSIVSTLHVHLDHDNCLEVIVVRGKAREVRQLADSLIGAKGVKHGKLATTTTGKGLK